MTKNSKLNKPQGILFDLDGTLLDTANDLGETLNYILRKHQFPEIARERYRPVASDGALGLLKLGFGDALEQFDYESLRAEFLAHYQENIAVHTCLYDGVEELLSTLDNANIPWGIVTNKPQGLTELLLPNFEALDTSKVMVGGDTLAQRKPHPAPILHACKALNIAENQCIYVGDAPRDIEAGNAANMFTIAAKWGYIDDTEQCKTWQADYLADSPTDILPYIV
ncbi:HAD family hydrolase [Thalassotalea sp. PLHSN55]|uniref:HAD family hydrolase n=1 Tax=Thalassotalea sp. PLHSN55 TaxID=3435888 RepID=UPI003F825FDE